MNKDRCKECGQPSFKTTITLVEHGRKVSVVQAQETHLEICSKSNFGYDESDLVEQETIVPERREVKGYKPSDHYYPIVKMDRSFWKRVEKLRGRK